MMDLEQFRKIYSDYRLAEARAKSAQYSSWDYSSHRFTMRSAAPKEQLYTRIETLVPRPPDGSKLSVTTLGNPLSGGITSSLAGKDYRDTSSKFITYGNLFGHEGLDSDEIDLIKQTMNSLNATIFTESVKSLNDSTKSPGLILSETVIQFMQAAISSLYNLRASIQENDQNAFLKSGLDLQRLSTNPVLTQKALPQNATKILQGLCINLKSQLEIFSRSEEVVSVNDAIDDVQNLNADTALEMDNQNAAINDNSTKAQQVIDPLARRIDQKEDADIKKINVKDVEKVNVFLSDFAQAVTNGTTSSTATAQPALQTSLSGDKSSWKDNQQKQEQAIVTNPQLLSPNFEAGPNAPILPEKSLAPPGYKPVDFNADVQSAETVRDSKDALNNSSECQQSGEIPSNVPQVSKEGIKSNFVGETKESQAFGNYKIPKELDGIFTALVNAEWANQSEIFKKLLPIPGVLEFIVNVPAQSNSAKSFFYMKEGDARRRFLTALQKNPNPFNDRIVFIKSGLSTAQNYESYNKSAIEAMAGIGSGIPKGRGRPRKRERSELKEHSYVGSGIIPAVLGNTTLSTEEVLAKHGCDVIYDMTLLRSPLPTHMNEALDMVSSGEFTRLKKKYNYDEVFHSAIKVNSSILIEKNAHGVNVAIYAPYPAEEEVVVSRLFGNPDMTIKNLLGRTKDTMGERFYTYNAFSNNCQLFISTILKSNGLMKPEYANFIYQDMTELLKDLREAAPLALPLIDATTAALGIKQKIDAYNEYNKAKSNS